MGNDCGDAVCCSAAVDAATFRKERRLGISFLYHSFYNTAARLLFSRCLSPSVRASVR